MQPEPQKLMPLHAGRPEPLPLAGNHSPHLHNPPGVYTARDMRYVPGLLILNPIDLIFGKPPFLIFFVRLEYIFGP